MKAIILTTALAFGLAAPAVASSQMEQLLNVPAGVHSNNELAELFTKRHLDSANERASNLDEVSDVSTTVTTRSAHGSRAQAIFANIRAESLEDE